MVTVGMTEEVTVNSLEGSKEECTSGHRNRKGPESVRPEECGKGEGGDQPGKASRKPVLRNLICCARGFIF